MQGVIKLCYGIDGRRIHISRIAIDNIIIRIQLNYFLNQHCSNSQYNVAQDSTQTVSEVVSCVCILVVYFQEELRF
jgi:hypothetical protein